MRTWRGPLGGAALALVAGAALVRGGEPPPGPGQPDPLAAAADPLEAALVLARELDPGTDPAPVRAAVEQATTGLRRALESLGPAPLEARGQALARAVHEGLGLVMEEDPALHRGLAVLWPGEVLARRRGACLGLALWYLAIGRRAGLDAVGVALPGHFFVRLREGQRALNLETTLGGVTRDEQWYRKQCGLPAEGPPPGNYLRDLTSVEVAAELLNNAGGALLAAGDARRARALFARAVALAPEDPDAWYDLALARRELTAPPSSGAPSSDHAASALEAVERALALHPRSREALNLRGLLRLEPRPDLAEADFSAALELEPGEARYACNRGLARWRLGDLPGASADLERALALRPDWPEARRGLVLVRLERGESPAAAASLDALGLEARAALLHELPPGAAGGVALEQLVAASHEEWPAVAAAALLEQAARALGAAPGGSDVERARAACDRALALRGCDRVRAFCLRGLACEAAGDQLWAKRSFVLAMEHAPRDPRGFRHMGDYYLRRDRLAVAAEYLRGYLERAPADAPDRAHVQALVAQVEAGKGHR